MATYVITPRRNSNPDNENERLLQSKGFKYRRFSREGHECAEEAFARLTSYPERTLWRYDHESAAKLIKCAADVESKST